MAIICLLTAYKEDFIEPPYYTTLNYLITNLPDRDIQKQGENLLEDLKNDEENNSCDINNNPNQMKNDSIYNQKGFDYITPWNFLDMPSTTIAEQLTIVDAVNKI